MKTAVATTPSVVVPRLWPDGTIVCLASGPSLTTADAEYVRGKADAVIAVNNAYQVAPWADCLYACDAKWWRWNWKQGASQFTGLKYAMTSEARNFPGVQILKNAGDKGLTRDPSELRTGKNSGYQAINLAVHFGAKRIVLLGYDMQGDHFFGSHPDKSKPPFAVCLRNFSTLVSPLRDLGVEIVNCTRRTALKCFPQQALEDVLR